MSYKVQANSKVLVVDDEKEITEIIDTYLTEFGFKVSVENDPQNAIKKAIEFKPDLILLDIMMPGTDGYDVCEQIKKSKECKNVPIVFLTGKDRDEDMGRSFQSGGDMFIKKPFACERLLEIINIVLMSAGNSDS